MGESIMVGVGCFALGVVIGGIVAHYIAKVREFNLRSMTAVVAILGGAGVISIFKLMGTQPTTAFWMYPVGLLIGMGLIGSINMVDRDKKTGRNDTPA